MRSTGRALALALGVVLAVAALGACQSAKKGAGAPNLAVTPIVGGLNNPWDVAFAPDAMYFTERTGAIRALVGGNPMIVGIPGDVVATGEGGMMGIAVDPEYASNRVIYTCYTTAVDVRIVRWQIAGDFSHFTAGVPLVTGMPYNGPGVPGTDGRHSGCRLKIGSDGYLWAGTGDAAITGTAQSLGSHGGKVLRLDRNGAPAPGNASGFIYTYGHRNVQGLAFRPGNGQAYSVEHGPGCDDEVNLLVAGSNYGWAPGPGYNENVPMTFAGATPSVWSSGCPTIAPSGATFLDGPQWKGWNGALAVAVLKDRHLRIMFVAANGGISGTAVALPGSPRLRGAVQGPDGNLYITTDVGGGGGEIWRVQPS